MSPLDWISLMVALPITVLAIAIVFMTRCARHELTPSVSPKPLNMTLWSITTGLSVLYLTAGFPKLLRLSSVVSQFTEWGYSVDFMLAIGVVEMLAAVLLLFPATATVASLVLSAVMVGSAYTHIANGELAVAIVPLCAFTALAYVGWERWEDAVTSARAPHSLPLRLA